MDKPRAIEIGVAAFARRVRGCLGGSGLNGKIWQRGLLGHTCRYVGCCTCRADAEAKGITCVSFLLRSIPQVPQISKWTKLLPVLVLLMAAGVGGLLEEAVIEAGKHFKFPQGQHGDEGQEEAAEVDWHKLAGKRYRRGVGFLSSPSQHFFVCLLAVVIEPLRCLHSRFMSLGHKIKSGVKLPSIFNEFDDSRSLVVRVLRYYSSLLRLTCKRARLFWQWSGAPDALGWLRDHTLEARTARRLILSAASGVKRRLGELTKSFPWLLISLGDLRRADGRDIAKRFRKTSWCCLRAGLSRLFKERGLTEEDMISQQWRQFFFAVGFSLHGSVAAVEKRHAFHHRHASPDMQWHRFAALSVAGEAQRIHDARDAATAAEAEAFDDEPGEPRHVPDAPRQPVSIRL